MGDISHYQGVRSDEICTTSRSRGHGRSHGMYPSVNRGNHTQNSTSVDLQQRCYEFIMLKETLDVMSDVLPIDAFCEDIDVDEGLGFLAGYVLEHSRSF